MHDDRLPGPGAGLEASQPTSRYNHCGLFSEGNCGTEPLGEVLVSVELLAGKQAVSTYRLLSLILSQRLGGLCQGWDLGLHPPFHSAT